LNAKRTLLGLCALVAVGLAACSPGAAPQLISSYPLYGTPGPGAPPGRVYNTSLYIEVSDVDDAARQATRLAVGVGGYLVSAQSWSQDERPHTALVLAVPPSNFDGLRQSLIGLGRLLGEQLTSQPAPYPSEWPQPTSTISVTFAARPARPDWPALPSLGWSPARTFNQAFGVFAAIFTFLLNVLIWISVVVGPFVLMGLGLRWLVRRMRRPV
jgi:hypothetical protein